MAKNPSHLEIVFKSARRVRREQIAGATMLEGADIMEIVPKGARKRIVFGVARELVINELALEVNATNRDAIAELEAGALREKIAAAPAKGKKQLAEA